MTEASSEPKIVRQGDALLYPKLIFNRPVNPIQQPIVVFVHELLPALNQQYEMATVLKTKPQVVLISNQHTDQAAEAMLGLQTIKPSDSIRLNEVLEDAEINASFLSIGYISTLPSAIQITLDRFLIESSVPVLLSGSTWQLLAANPTLLQKSNLVLNCTTIECIKLCNALHIPVHTSVQRGAYQLTDLAQSLLRHQPNIQIIISDNANIVMATWSSEDTKICLWHSLTPIQDIQDYWCGVAASMLAYPLRNLKDNFCERLLNGTYLLQNSLVHQRAVPSSLRRIYESVSE